MKFKDDLLNNVLLSIYNYLYKLIRHQIDLLLRILCIVHRDWHSFRIFSCGRLLSCILLFIVLYVIRMLLSLLSCNCLSIRFQCFHFGFLDAICLGKLLSELSLGDRKLSYITPTHYYYSATEMWKNEDDRHWHLCHMSFCGGVTRS